MAKEFFDIYDDAGNRIGTALRSECHGNPALLHRTAHVVVIHPDTGDILLQKRKMTKDIQPGKWDTAVGGHLDAGEDYLAGAKRELSEELGISGDVKLKWLFVEKVRNSIESEDAGVFALSILGATPLVKHLAGRIPEKVAAVLEPAVLAGLLLVCTGYLVDGSFSPFLYFRF